MVKKKTRPIEGKGKDDLDTKNINEYLSNPLLFGSHLATGGIQSGLFGKSFYDPKKASDRKALADTKRQISNIGRDVGKYLNPATLFSGLGLYAQGQGLYAEEKEFRGKGHGIHSYTKVVPHGIRGGAMKRNLATSMDAGIVGVSGNLLSQTEQHHALSSQPFYERFHQRTQMPIQFQPLYNTIV
jgi:hypothetical protein